MRVKKLVGFFFHLDFLFFHVHAVCNNLSDPGFVNIV